MSSTAITCPDRVWDLIRELREERMLEPPYRAGGFMLNNRMLMVIEELEACLPDPDADLLERMAAEMWDRHRNKAMSPRWEGAGDDVRTTFRGHARAALDAYRIAASNGRNGVNS